MLIINAFCIWCCVHVCVRVCLCLCLFLENVRTHRDTIQWFICILALGPELTSAYVPLQTDDLGVLLSLTIVVYSLTFSTYCWLFMPYIAFLSICPLGLECVVKVDLSQSEFFSCRFEGVC